MDKMTLARALRYKKRVLETIRQLETDIQYNNSKVEGEEREIDITLARQQRSQWVAHLVDLKLALQEKTRPIQRFVFELAESKSEIAFLQRIDVTNGTQRGRYRDEQSVKMEAILRKPERDRLVADLQKKIDELQTKIDAFNAETLIEVKGPELP